MIGRQYDAKIQKDFELRRLSTLFIEKILKNVCKFQKKRYLCTDKSRPLPIRTAYPAGHFLYIDMRYTKQAMTLTQQILALQSRGLIIADTNKAEQAYPLKPATPRVMPNKWLTDFTFREESLYAQLCCIAYWLNAINTNNIFVGDLKLLLLRNPSIDPTMMGFPHNWRQEPLWQL